MEPVIQRLIILARVLRVDSKKPKRARCLNPSLITRGLVISLAVTCVWLGTIIINFDSVHVINPEYVLEILHGSSKEPALYFRAIDGDSQLSEIARCDLRDFLVLYGIISLNSIMSVCWVLYFISFKNNNALGCDPAVRRSFRINEYNRGLVMVHFHDLRYPWLRTLIFLS